MPGRTGHAARVPAGVWLPVSEPRLSACQQGDFSSSAFSGASCPHLLNRLVLISGARRGDWQVAVAWETPAGVVLCGVLSLIRRPLSSPPTYPVLLERRAARLGSP